MALELGIEKKDFNVYTVKIRTMTGPSASIVRRTCYQNDRSFKSIEDRILFSGNERQCKTYVLKFDSMDSEVDRANRSLG